MGTPTPPGQNGTIDVKPSDLFRVSGLVALQQGVLNRGAKDLAEALDKYPDAGGYGTSPQAFSTAYMKVGNRFLEVWAKSVVSVGGAAVGFTSTANNYAKAEAAAHPSGTKQPVTQPLPQVIEKAPDYGQVPDLKWGDNDGGDDILRTLLEGVPEPVRDVLRPVVKHAFRMGKVADVYPYPQQHYLNSLSKGWMSTMMCLSMVESSLTAQVGTITNQTNTEWHDAMRTFCSSLWGTTAWGKSTAGYEWKHDTASSSAGATHPVMTVLFDTAKKIGDLLYEYAQAAVTLNGDVWDVYMDAVREALPKIDLKDGLDFGDVKGFVKGVVKVGGQLGAGIVLNIDTGKLNTIVNTYNTRLDGLTSQFGALTEALDEAHRSAPTFRAESARAQSFGARALNEFKPGHTYAVPGEDKENHFYPIDLAGQEGIHGSHPVDRHIGYTDDQLAQRLRDQGNAPSASTFNDLPSAQRFTQAALDDVDNAERVEKWIEGVERKIQNNPQYDPDRSKIDPPLTLSFNESTGRTVTRADYDAHGMNAPAGNTDAVKVVLQYKQGMDPPFVVLTSMPVPK